ncbi:MAG TPA: LpxL/LpxP family Kdo(2)-lipid IV(A) lauroyl/palmitoleoyl acyltransferase [Steroidobacteraceae bacterium]|nr:LpxL/LpxP family Kdo(2)-lipid IV(A) lauroyl/palmitoleoyl acyltransferase [Steroidobacteraceae bacterium]
MPQHLLGPRYWPTWLGLGLLRLIQLLPHGLLLAMGRSIGRVVRHLPLHYAKVARCNLQLCLPELTAAERERVLKQHFEALGMGLCESAMTWWGSDTEITRLSRVVGVEHLRHALAQGRGAILLTAHFTTLEIGARVLNTQVPLNAMHKPPKNELLGYFFERHRGRHALRIFSRDNVRGMVRALRDNECVWYAPDQSYRKKGAQMVHFFGVPAATNVFTSRLAEMTGAAVLFVGHERLAGNDGYCVTLYPAPAGYPSASAIEDAEQFHRFVESEVRRIPAQYWWIHRRFKGLTADYPNYYGSAARS